MKWNNDDYPVTYNDFEPEVRKEAYSSRFEEYAS